MPLLPDRHATATLTRVARSALVAVAISLAGCQVAPPVEKGTLWFDTVKRGDMSRDVNAPGTLEAMYPEPWRKSSNESGLDLVRLTIDRMVA